MAHTFEITRPQDSVILDASGNGKIPFTITNVTPRPIKARLELLPDKRQDLAMLTMEGGSELSFKGNDTQTVNVFVKAPKSAVPGEHKFVLKVIDSEFPDDNREESQGVSFSIPEQQKKKFPWWIVIVAAALIVCIGLGWYVFSDKKIQVDDYTGKPYADVSAQLQSEGLVPEKGDEVTDKTKAAGLVVDQSLKNTKVPKGTKITFIVNAQRIRVRRVKGLPIEEAKTRFSDDGFIVAKAVTITNQVTDDGGSIGRVMAQTPDPDADPNASAFAGGPIGLTAGVPRENGILSDYIGHLRCEAYSSVVAAGFNPQVIFNPAAAGNDDAVTSQSLPAGPHPKGSQVTLVIAGNLHLPCSIIGCKFCRTFANERPEFVIHK